MLVVSIPLEKFLEAISKRLGNKEFLIIPSSLEIGFSNFRLELRQVKEEKILNMSSLLPLKKDFAFIINSNISAEKLIQEIKKVDPKIGEITVFDVYKNEDKSELSLAIEVEIVQQYKVLNTKEIGLLMDDIIKNVEKKVGAKLRTR